MTETPPAPATLQLSDLKTGVSCHVIQITGDDDVVSRRLHDAGFWPGTHVQVSRKAPFGDPTQYNLHGYRLALRKSEASRIEVSVQDNADE
jgi:ferrous iron transport protein A